MTVDVITNMLSGTFGLLVFLILLAMASFGPFAVEQTVVAEIRTSDHALRTHSLAMAFMENYNQTDEGRVTRQELLSRYFSTNEGQEVPIKGEKTMSREELEEDLYKWNENFLRKFYSNEDEEEEPTIGVTGDNCDLFYSTENYEYEDSYLGSYAEASYIARTLYIEDGEDLIFEDFRENYSYKSGVKLVVPHLKTGGEDEEGVKEVWINARSEEC